MTHYCPHCGHNLTADKPIERDGWELTVTMARLDGIPVAISKFQAIVLHSLAATDAPIRPEVLAARASSNSMDGKMSVHNAVHRLRRVLGKRCPIETVLGRGYRWAA